MDESRAEPAAVPPDARLSELLDAYAPFAPHPLVPEVSVFQARGLVEVWEAAERLAGGVVAPPFWAFAWPGGSALARTVLDHPEKVAGRRVLDLGTGGGVAALAAARAGAGEVVANDQDPWALATARLAAARQGLSLTFLPGDLTLVAEAAEAYDVVLCGDMAYERSVAPRIRAFLDRARAAGATVLVADAGRTYFDATGMRLLGAWTLSVPEDLEGVEERTARVYEME